METDHPWLRGITGKQQKMRILGGGSNNVSNINEVSNKKVYKKCTENKTINYIDDTYCAAHLNAISAPNRRVVVMDVSIPPRGSLFWDVYDTIIQRKNIAALLKQKAQQNAAPINKRKSRRKRKCRSKRKCRKKTNKPTLQTTTME